MARPSKSLRPLAQKLARELSDVPAGEKLDQMLGEVVKALAAKGALHRWRELSREIDRAWKELYGASRIEVTSASRLPEEALESLVRKYPGADLTTVIDSRLLGGAKIRLDDTVIDNTVKGTLERLKKHLS